MNSSIHLLAVLCVAMIAGGQVLFKLTARELHLSTSIIASKPILIGLCALALYAAATLIWIALLRNAPLSRLYPYMALSFVLVAAAGWWVFGEPVALAQIAGLGLILAGLLVIAAAA